LEENIPLSDEEVKKIEKEQRKLARIMPAIQGGCSLFGILVNPEDYSQYKTGTKAVVIYLKYSKTALSIKKL